MNSKLYERLRNLGFSGDDLLKVEAGILEAEATVIRLLHGNGGEDFHAYLDPLCGVFASLFAERNWDESVEKTVLELVSDALIERVESFLPPGRPERTEEFCERYGSFWVPACFPAQLKRNLAGPIKQWHARAILAQLTRTANHDSAVEQPAKPRYEAGPGEVGARVQQARDRLATLVNSAIDHLMSLPGFHKADSKMRKISEPLLHEIEKAPMPRPQAVAWFDSHAGSYLGLVTDQPSWNAYRVLLYELWYPQAYEYLFGFVGVVPLAPEGVALASTLHARLRHWHKEASGALAKSQSSLLTGIPAKAKMQPKGRVGRPPKDQTRNIHAEWVRIGKPERTAAVCDRIADTFFTRELNGIPRGSPQHRKARERVRQALQRFERRSAT